MIPPNFRFNNYDPYNPDLDARVVECESCANCVSSNPKTGICQKYQYVVSFINNTDNGFDLFPDYFCDNYHSLPSNDISSFDLKNDIHDDIPKCFIFLGIMSILSLIILLADIFTP